jgi:hypothetical protein
VFLFGAEFAAVYAHRHGSRATRNGPSLPELAGSDEHGSRCVSSNTDEGIHQIMPLESRNVIRNGSKHEE